MYEDQSFIRLVNQMARESAEQGFDPFSALLARSGQVVASSIDKCIEYADPTAHAELTVIAEYCRKNKLIDLAGYTLYCNVEPCLMCCGAIHWAKISRVVYGLSQKDLQRFSGGKPKPDCRTLINIGGKSIEIKGPLLQEECLGVFRQFPFQSKKQRFQKYIKNL